MEDILLISYTSTNRFLFYMNKIQVDLSKYKNTLSRKHQIIRLIWNVVWFLLARPIPRSLLSGWKRFLLRLFGAQVDKTAIIYSSAKIYYPKHLVMKQYSCISSNVNCYNVDYVQIGDNSTISQGAYLCTASHDIYNSTNPLITSPIIIEDQAWIATDAFIGMGVTIGQGAVVGARAAVFRNVKPWTIVGGNPAKEINKRVLFK